MIIGVIFAVVLAAVVISLFVLVKLKRLAQSIGERGEKYVARALGDTVEGEQYIINNLLFQDSEGHSCQIDHILINKNGIWVVETKNYAGYIYGSEEQREWTQVLAYGDEKHKFYNPVKQNRTHIYRLSKYLNADKIFHNVICFLNRADITNVRANGIYSIYNIKEIKEQETNVNLTAEDMEKYYNLLLELKESNQVTEEQHINNIHQMQENIQQGICPRCGAQLVLRNGKNGQFYGCANYPDCRFTKRID